MGRWDKIHTTVTCNNFPCQDSECTKRHPRVCKNFAVNGHCMFAERCSYLHYSCTRGEHTANDGLHEIMQAVSALREEVNTLRLEVDRLVRGTDAKSSDLNHNHLLEMIKDLNKILMRTESGG